MIAAAHTIIYADDAGRARAFFRDVLDFPAIDSGDGWLIFELPPGELAVHPAEAGASGRHELFLMCRDIRTSVAELEQKGVEFVAPVSDEGWGLLTRLKIPGAGELGLYEPRHREPARRVLARLGPRLSELDVRALEHVREVVVAHAQAARAETLEHRADR